MRRSQLFVQPVQRLPQLGGSPDRTERIVLPDPGNAEHGHDRVSDEFLDRPAVPLDHRAHRLVVASEHGLEPLRVEQLAELGGPDDVGEQDRHAPSVAGTGVG